MESIFDLDVTRIEGRMLDSFGTEIVRGFHLELGLCMAWHSVTLQTALYHTGPGWQLICGEFWGKSA